MSRSTPNRKGSHTKPLKDRRAAEGARAGPLRKIKSALVRPIGIERRDGQLQVVLVERRRAAPVDEPPSIDQLCTDLSARLLAHEPDQAAKSMRHLVLVHDALAHKGWSGVAALPAHVLHEALAQAEGLASEEDSSCLTIIIENLRPLVIGAERREERDSRMQDFRVGENLEVKDSDFAEFEDAERGWSGTVPADLVPHEGDTTWGD